MDIKKALADFKAEIDQEIKNFLDREIAIVLKKDRFVAEALKYVKKSILAGGKRLRPAMVYYGYSGAGGKNLKEALKAAISIELIHFFLLIHDDIIDSDSTRHGIDTVHYRYYKIGKRFFLTCNQAKFGESVAIIIGDLISALGNRALFSVKFDADIIIKALIKLQNIIELTVIGQSQDVLLGCKKRAQKEDVFKMYENKTARYTIEGPLHLGGILAGASQEVMDGFTRLAIPIGIAFQIQDDILGIFGTEKKIGKPVGSDIREGKQTILVVKALEKADKKQRKELENILGKENLNQKEIEIFRDIIVKTGSLDYARNMALELIQKGKTEIEKLEIKKEAKEFLLGLADYMASREN